MLNMYYRYIKLKLHEIQLWRWVLLMVFFLMVAYSDLTNLSLKTYSFIEVVIIELNDYFNICYYFLFAIVIISSDIFNCSKEVFFNHIFIKLGTRKKYLKANIIYIIFLSLITIIIFILITLAAYLIIFKGFYPDQNTFLKSFGLTNVSVYEGFILSISLVLCRFIFLNNGIFIINVKSNYPIGFLFVFFISIIDYWFYEIFQIMSPLFILPIEHTRIFYTEAVAPAMQTVSRISYNISYLYWLSLIVVEIFIMMRILTKKDYITLEYVN